MSSPRFASAASRNEDLDRAAVEASGALLSGLGAGPPDLLIAFATRDWPSGQSQLPGLGRRLRELTGAEQLIGCTALATLEGAEEIEGQASLALLGLRSEDAALRTQRIQAHREYGGAFRFDGLDLESPEQAGLVIFGDPYSFPMPALLDHLGEEHQGLAVTGGMASGGSGHGEHLLWLDDEAHAEGAVGTLISGGLELVTAVSQGCRPIGDPLVITASKGNLILKLRGRPAAKMMMGMLEELDSTERELFQRGAFVGLALDPTKSTFEASDFLVRNLMGFAPQEQAIAVASPEIRTGMTMQFLVRDAASASEELTRVLERSVGECANEAARRSVGGLLMTCGGRGQGMFGEPDHDARHVQRTLGPDLPLAGFFANGEVGMVGSRAFLHGFTASLAILRARR